MLIWGTLSDYVNKTPQAKFVEKSSGTFNLLEMSNGSYDTAGHIVFETKVLRRIHGKDNADRIRKIVDLGVDGLIPTKFIDDSTVEHLYVPFISLLSEWTPDMAKDAAIFFVRFLRKLSANGYMLKDGHPLNVQFIGTRPYFIDLGSIVRGHWNDHEHWWKEFQRTFGLRLEELGAPKGWVKDLDQLEEKLSGLSLSPPDKGWASYAQSSHEERIKLIGTLAGRTFVDLCGNQGNYAFAAVKLGKQVVLTDYAFTAVNRAYLKAKEDGIDVLPLAFDLRKLYGEGAVGADQATRDHIVRPSHTRLHCDSGIAFGVTHHLFRAGWTWAEMAKRFSQFVTWDFAVEFVPKEDKHVAAWGGMPDNYNVDAFVAELGKYWKSITAVRIVPEPRLMLVLREKIHL